RLARQEMIPGGIACLVAVETAVDEPGPSARVQMHAAAILVGVSPDVGAEAQQHVRLVRERALLPPTAAGDDVAAFVGDCGLCRRAPLLALGREELEVIAET